MFKRIRRSVALAIGISVLTPVLVQASPGTATIQLRTQQSYVVQSGDTLWGIAGHFLLHPWQWPQLWHENDYIHNPNLIYPGDRIVIRMVGGRPELQIAHTVELIPHMSTSAIPTVSTGLVLPFLANPGVISSKDSFATLPYIAAAAKQRPIYVAGDTMYTVGLSHATVGSKFEAVRLGQKLIQPTTHHSLGYTLEDLGTVKVTHGGHHTSVLVLNSRKGLEPGARLIPLANVATPHYFPSAPSQPVHGSIIGKLSSAPALTAGQAVIIDAGSSGGLIDGDTLRITHQQVAANAVTGNAFMIPAKNIGDIMVFRVFRSVSYAIITESRHTIQVGDSVESASQ